MRAPLPRQILEIAERSASTRFRRSQVNSAWYDRSGRELRSSSDRAAQIQFVNKRAQVEDLTASLLNLIGRPSCRFQRMTDRRCSADSVRNSELAVDKTAPITVLFATQRIAYAAERSTDRSHENARTTVTS